MKIKRDGIMYTLSPKTLTAVVSSCDEKKKGKVVLPAQVEHKEKIYVVTEIGDNAFMGCSIQSIVISENVQSIGDRAFYACGDLEDVFIPKSVTHIGERAFECYEFGYGDGYTIETPSHLTSIVVESGNPVYDSRNDCNAIIETATNMLLVGSANTIIPVGIQSIAGIAFEGCTGLTSIDIPDSVKDIYGMAFASCSNLSSVRLHNGTTSIGDSSFECTSLKSIYIPGSIQKIEYHALSGCPLESIVVDSSNPVYDSRDNCNAIIETATNTLLEGSANTKIPSSVTLIGDNAFAGRTSLTHIDIPGTVISIKSDAFRNCENLVSISFSEGLQKIGSDVFNGCSSLTDLVFPNSLTELDINYFYDCDNLKTLVIPNSIVSTECIGMESLLQLPQLTYLQLPPDLLIDICSSAFNYHYERDDEKDKETGIKITMENDAMCFSIPMPVLCQHLKLRPDCKINAIGTEESTIRLGDIFEGREELKAAKGNFDDDIPYFPE